jgi:hypothetical protein
MDSPLARKPAGWHGFFMKKACTQAGRLGFVESPASFEHCASKHLINYPDQKIATKPIVIVLEYITKIYQERSGPSY